MSEPGHDGVDPGLRTGAQVGLIREAFRGTGVDIGVAPPQSPRDGEVGYLYAGGWILVRDEDTARVLAVLYGDRARRQIDEYRDDNLINGITRVRVPDGDTLGTLEALDRRLGVGVATPDHVLSICPAAFCPGTEPVPPGEALPPPLASAGSDRVFVSVVDTGWVPGKDDAIDLSGVTGDVEDWYAAAVLAGGVSPATPIPPYGGHGRFVAGVLRSVAPDTDVYVHKVFNRAGAVLEGDIVRALDAALDLSPDVISMSAGTNSRLNLDLLGFEVFHEKRLRHYKGVALVAAAGNNSERYPFWPAAFPWTVSVGSLNEARDGIAWFSNYGRWVDVYAPGEAVAGAFVSGSYTYREPPLAPGTRVFEGKAVWSGTSFATPFVTGRIARAMAEHGTNGHDAARGVIRDAPVTPGVGRALS
jgi:hypothetical protein